MSDTPPSDAVWPPPPSNRADIERRVIQVVSEVIDRKGLTLETELNPAVDLDSLEDTELIMSLEEEFDISIPNEAAKQFFLEHRPSIRDIVELVIHYVH